MQRLQFKSPLYGEVSLNEPLSLHTSMRVGGPAVVWIEPDTIEKLRALVKLCRKKKISVFTIGRGCNIIVGKKGIPGICVKLTSDAFNKIEFKGIYVKAGAGVLLNELLRSLSSRSLGGCEFLAGIPGTVGGAIFGNAGAQEQSVSSFIKKVAVVDKTGTLKIIAARDIKFGYRFCSLDNNIIIWALFKFKKSSRNSIDSLIRQNLAKKIKSQDYTAPSAGCIFRNVLRPKISAGQLIDACGLKGKIKGRAQVSKIHANFIINKGNAAADDVFSLIKLIKAKVKSAYGINLKEEVRIIR